MKAKYVNEIRIAKNIVSKLSNAKGLTPLEFNRNKKLLGSLLKGASIPGISLSSFPTKIPAMPKTPDIPMAPKIPVLSKPTTIPKMPTIPKTSKMPTIPKLPTFIKK